MDFGLVWVEWMVREEVGKRWEAMLLLASAATAECRYESLAYERGNSTFSASWALL